MMVRLCLLWLALFVGSRAHGLTLFDKGRSTYTIVVGRDASVSEHTAAKELQDYLKQVGGVTLPVSDNLQERGNCIFVGYNSRVAGLTGVERPADDDETFTYQTAGDHIVIYGGRQRGTMYGVYAFLENELGVRWYTHDCTRVPRLRSWSARSLHHTESPAVKHRYVMYYRCADDAGWAAHNRNNFYWGNLNNQYGGAEACLGVHTMGEYVPKDEFFERHPEYFALRGGKRVADGQPCLSNPDVLRLVTERVLERIAKNPDYLYYDVSQRDNQLFCECPRCQQTERRYGNRHSGIMLWFVNQVADAVAQRYPDKKLCTFAYQYTRQAPQGIRPRDNVTVRLCDIECCFAHPLEQCGKNKSFMRDLQEWSGLTRDIFIWDYVVNFGQYLAPYPNFGVLAANVRTFVKHGAATVLEQGQRQSAGGEFAELKAWVLAKLLWNPEQDADKLAQQFISGYYGAAAPYVQKYFSLCQQQVKADTHIYQSGKAAMDACDDSFVKRAGELVDKALAQCRDEATRSRVEHVRAQVLYLRMTRNPIWSMVDGTKSDFVSYVQRYKPHIWEGQSAEQYLKDSK